MDTQKDNMRDLVIKTIIKNFENRLYDIKISWLIQDKEYNSFCNYIEKCIFSHKKPNFKTTHDVVMKNSSKLKKLLQKRSNKELVDILESQIYQKHN